MDKESKFGKYVFPVILIIISAAVGYLFSQVPSFSKEAELQLENLYIPEEPQETMPYGAWNLVSVTKDEYDREQRSHESYLESWPNRPDYPEFKPAVNSLGELAYLVKWSTKSKITSNIQNLVYGLNNPFIIPKDLRSEIDDYYLIPQVEEYINSVADSLTNMGVDIYDRDFMLMTYLNRDHINSVASDKYSFDFEEYIRRSSLIRYQAFMNLLAEKAELPEVRIAIRNAGNKPASIYGIYAKNIFSTGGEAGAGGPNYVLKVMNDKRILHMDYNSNASLLFENPLIIEADNPALLEVNLHLKDGSAGDGPGTLTYALFLKYHNGDELVELYVGTFIQDDGIDDLATY